MKRFNHLTLKQLKELKGILDSEKKRILDSHHEQEKEFRVTNEERSNEADIAMNDYNNSHMLRLRNRELFYLKKIGQALKKFEQEEYGHCEDCGEEIKATRLKARPTAELCIVCKEESEMDEQQSLLGGTSKSYNDIVDLSVR
jgi:DnaK suppressor protein